MAQLTKAIARLMEERAQTAADVSEHRQLLEQLRALVAPGERSVADAFVRLLLQRASPEWIGRQSTEALLGRCASAWRFFAAAGSQPRVRVLNPEFERDGWDAPATVVETVLSDRPFIVDTVRETLHRAGCSIRCFLHPVVGVERDPKQAIVSVVSPEAALQLESFMHAEVEPIADAGAREALEAELRDRLGDLLLATNDYQAIRRAIETLANALRAKTLAHPSDPPLAEVAAFLDWLREGNFVFLGYREYRLVGAGETQAVVADPATGLGLLRKARSAFAAPRAVADLPAPVQRRIAQGPPLIITKTNAESPIHRRARMDYIGVRDYDAQDRVRGEQRLIGLFTSRAFACESAQVPLLRQKLDAILSAEEAIPGSHDYKAFVSFFNSMPKEYLFAATADELRQDIHTILAAEGTDDIRVTVRPDQLERGVFVMAVLARDRFSADLQRDIRAAAVRTYAATVLHQHVAMDESDQVRLHFHLATPAEAARNAHADALEREMRELLRTWADRLRDALERSAAPGARQLAQRYAAIFSPEYKAATGVNQAALDVAYIEALLASALPQIQVANPADAAHTLIKLYLMERDLVLSDFLPVLENLGLRVFAADPVALSVPDAGVVHLHSFLVQDRAGQRLDVRAVGALVGDAILAHLAGRLVNDPLNALVTTAALPWQHVHLLRTYAAHLAQTGFASRATCLGALARHPGTARLLWAYFAARFDPGLVDPPHDRLARTLPGVEQQVLGGLDAVDTVADDNALRAILATMTATVRTNYFAPRDDGAVAIKLRSDRLEHLPLPRPAYEIFACAPHVEGVHLRAGKVARGGIRLTDRPDDYRAEVLGLMKTQTAKNAIIIPTGAKGGFLVRATGGSPPGSTEIVRGYRTFIGCLLQLTDNIVRGALVPASDIRYDDPDPYLVVAADKGTASFSDIANEVAAAHEFWLGDAFASGGSHGYDHKRIGITARGAWECVRRHFRELGVDADRDPITVVGIGDMSGDVFGNAMLLSRNLRLRAAFNHLHIFLDPDPDPARSFAERHRLFGLPRSSWDDYDRTAISAGGGVHLRGAKKIPLTPEVRGMLGVEATALSGEALIRAILCMPADLLWNGGIGTYVKASFETTGAAGDSANDGVRVDAASLRVRAVGEGGNLGFTQHARVEYAIGGGRINTDAIDNAGGVGMSDREVNVKIALRALVEGGAIAETDRIRLLGELTEEVTAQVLEQNARQAFALTLDQIRSQTALVDFLDLVQQLEAAGVLDRTLERLPDREALRRRRAAFLGLTRPELATVLAHSKLDLQRRLLDSPLADDPSVETALHRYFPRPIVERYRHVVRTHRLRREIIAVELANEVIDIAGSAFVTRVQQETGCSAVAVVRAWAVVAAIGDVAPLYARLLRAAAALPSGAENDAVLRIGRALERACKWLIETQDPAATVADLVQRFLAPVCELDGQLPGLLREDRAVRLRDAHDRFAAQGLDPDSATRVAHLGHLDELLEISYLSTDLGTPLRLTADVYYRIGSVVDLDWIRDNLSAGGGEGRWERRAVEGLREGLVYARRVLARNVLACRGGNGAVEQCLSQYAAAQAQQIEQVRALLDDVKSAPRPTLAALVVVMREVGRLCGRG